MNIHEMRCKAKMTLFSSKFAASLNFAQALLGLIAIPDNIDWLFFSFFFSLDSLPELVCLLYDCCNTYILQWGYSSSSFVSTFGVSSRSYAQWGQTIFEVSITVYPQIVSLETILFWRWKIWKFSYSFRIKEIFTS